MTKAMELARAVVARSPVAVRAARQVVEAACERPQAEAFERAYEATAVVYASEDALEGIRAFLESGLPAGRGPMTMRRRGGPTIP